MEPVQPLLHNYDKAGNGITNIIVRQTKYGHRYQAHHLSWLAPPNFMPEERVGKSMIDGKEIDNAYHPRVWNNALNNFSLYKFNSSLYNDSVYTSRAYVVHSEHGFYGSLLNIVLTTPHDMVEGDILEIPFELCHPNESGNGTHDHYEEYEYHLTEAFSPFTTSPASQYRPAALGLLLYEQDLKY